MHTSLLSVKKRGRASNGENIFLQTLPESVNFLQSMVHILFHGTDKCRRHALFHAKKDKNKRSKGEAGVVKEVVITTRIPAMKRHLTNPFQFVCIGTIQDLRFREVSKLMDKIEFIGVRA